MFGIFNPSTVIIPNRRTIRWPGGMRCDPSRGERQKTRVWRTPQEAAYRAGEQDSRVPLLGVAAAAREVEEAAPGAP